MLSRAEQVVNEFSFEYAMRNFDRAFAMVHDEIAWAMHIPPEVGPFAGVSVGKAIARQRAEAIAAALELFSYDIEFARPSLDAVRITVRQHWRHRATAEDLQLTSRQLWSLRDDLLVSLDEFHDSPRVEAFFRLVATLPPVVSSGTTDPSYANDAIVRRLRVPVGVA